MVKFNVRGGAKWRKAYNKIRAKKTARYQCPSCGKEAVKRESAGVWACKSCGSKFAGGSYELVTPVGKLANRLIADLAAQQKVEIEEIEQAVEEADE